MELEFGYESRGKMLGVTLVTGYLHMGLWAERPPLPVMTAGFGTKGTRDPRKITGKEPTKYSRRQEFALKQRVG